MREPFEVLVRRHGAAVLRVCRAIVGPDDADDAWSETFLAALRAYPDLPVDANHQAWLVRIAHNKAVDLIRRHQHQARTSQALADEPRPPEPTEHPTITAAVAALPLRQRQAVAYHYLAGLPHAEVAELVGVSPAAARRAAADGIAALRRHLKEPIDV